MWVLTGFPFAVEGGECCQGADEDAEVGNGDGERDPVDHFGPGWSWTVSLG